MSLLLTFFVLLLSLSTFSEPEKFHEAMMSIQKALGIFDEGGEILPLDYPRVARSKERLRGMAIKLARHMLVEGQDKNVDIQYDEQEGVLQITLPERVLFDTARWDLNPEAEPVLNDVAAVLTEAPDAVIDVRGHTDNRPLVSQRAWPRDNYDLSYARAKTVARFLNQSGDIPIEQFEIVARGPSEPTATNETPEGQARNRRVEISVRGELEEDTIQRVREMIETLAPVVVEPSEEAAATGD